MHAYIREHDQEHVHVHGEIGHLRKEKSHVSIAVGHVAGRFTAYESYERDE